MKKHYKELGFLGLLVGIFLGCFYFPIHFFTAGTPFYEALSLVKWYSREHVLLCLVPAFFIAGGVAVFINKAAVVTYFGARANKLLSYAVASISGTILAVCSCTVLPLFSGIYKKGAGLGPATAFLYSGPAINILAIIMTARILGWELGIARALGAIVFSVVIGLLMHVVFRKEEQQRHESGELDFWEPKEIRPLWKTALFFLSLIAFLIFANWARPDNETQGFWLVVYHSKWVLSFISLTSVIILSFLWFDTKERQYWIQATWRFAKQILPLLLLGVFFSGLLLGRPGQEGIIPSHYISSLVGGNSFIANFFASVVGAFMYFATLTEIPILQGLLGAGMGKGPALALLLAGPALSLPNMLVIRSVIGTKKTGVYVMLVICMATFSGMIFGLYF